MSDYISISRSMTHHFAQDYEGESQYYWRLYIDDALRCLTPFSAINITLLIPTTYGASKLYHSLQISLYCSSSKWIAAKTLVKIHGHSLVLTTVSRQCLSYENSLLWHGSFVLKNKLDQLLWKIAQLYMNEWCGKLIVEIAASVNGESLLLSAVSWVLL